jgi:nicotinamidase-related amidase
MQTALLLIDIQNDYFPGGKMVVEGSLLASEQARRVLTAFRERNLPVFHVQHLSVRPGATFFIPETEGTEIHPNVKPLHHEPLIQKTFPNSFRDTSLLGLLKEQQIEHLIIGGMMTQMCVDATVRAAFDLGYRCTVLHDACAARGLAFGGQDVPAPQVHAAFLAALGAVYAKISSAEDYLKSLP